MTTELPEYFSESTLKPELVRLLPSFLRDVVPIICQYSTLYLEIHLDQHDDCSGKDVQKIFPTMSSKLWDSISISNGVLSLNSDTQIIGEEFCQVFSGVSMFGTQALEYTMDIGCNRAMYNRGLGVYFAPVDADEKKISARVSGVNRICYHPGMAGAQLRVEGNGGFANKNFGWEPQATENGTCLQTLTCVLVAGGVHTLILSSADGKTKSCCEWTNPKLVKRTKEGRYEFPKWGMYPSDMRGAPGAKVYYSSFNVRPLATSRSRSFLSDISFPSATPIFKKRI